MQAYRNFRIKSILKQVKGNIRQMLGDSVGKDKQ
jgi:uncharacterized protein YjbJ (UPF0337 family)